VVKNVSNTCDIGIEVITETYQHIVRRMNTVSINGTGNIGGGNIRFSHKVTNMQKWSSIIIAADRQKFMTLMAN